MSEAGDDVPVVMEEETTPAVVVPTGPKSVMEALQDVLKSALIADGLARGLHQAAKALDKRTAHVCVLAENCDEPMYVKLVEALCAEHNIPLIKVADNKQLGEWAGLCKYDKEGAARKVIKCSCCVIKEWGVRTDSHAILEQHLKQ